MQEVFQLSGEMPETGDLFQMEPKENVWGLKKKKQGGSIVLISKGSR